MKILYGVVGEGMGHATRSRVILNHLVKNHEVEIVVSGRAHQYLTQYFFNVVEIKGLHISYEKNAVDRSRTFWDFLKGLPEMIGDNFEEFVRLGERFHPDVVVSDFESFAYTFGEHHEIPVISIDNMQILSRCELDVAPPPGFEEDFKIAKAIVKGKLPGCYHYLITTFFFPPVRKEKTSLYPPILRNRILEARSGATTGDHLLVYQTTTTNDALLKVLEEVNLPCRVYGFGREEKIGKIHLRPFSEDGFIADLASCRGVLATGGFSLMGEAVYLGKPMLAVPVRKQYEQVLNALYLVKLGYGGYCETLTTEAIKGFVAKLDGYAECLKAHTQDGNTLLFNSIDRLLGEIEESRRGG
jgi:uncharacterized protein (TIGR00661 family)